MDAFVSYAHEDEWARDALLKHAAVLTRNGLISIWHDGKILPGDHVDQDINEAIEKSGLILFLIGPDFINSNYCMGSEMKRALELHRENAARLVPIICRPCDWDGIEELSSLLALPTDAIPISKWENQDEAWTVVVKGLRRLIQEDSSTQSNSVPSMPAPSEVSANQKKTRRIRARREFTEKDCDDFKEETYKFIREYFQRSIEELNGEEGVQGRIKISGTEKFHCTIVNLQYNEATAHITVGKGNSYIQNCAVYWLFDRDASEGVVDGAYTIESNGYNLYLKLNYSPTSRYTGDLDAEQAAERLWLEFSERAHIGYE